MVKLTASEAVVRCLAAEDVPSIFGIASGKLAPLYRAISEQNAIGFIGVRHEASAAHMAAGVFAGTGKLAVALGELGPGGGNLTSGIASAFGNSIPLLAITSSNTLDFSQPSRGMLMDIDMVRVFEPITKFSQCVYDGRRVPEIMQMAIRIALTGRPGPVHVSIPTDILGQTFDYDPDQFLPAERYRPHGGYGIDQRSLAAAADLLRAARRPLLIAGGGVTVSGASEPFRALAHALNAPATATQMGIGAVATDSPHFIGHGGVIGGPAILRAIAEADVILAVGCRFSSWLWDGPAPRLAADAKLIHIDTNPEIIGHIVPADIGIVADARQALAALAEIVTEGHADLGWREGLNAEWQRYSAQYSEARPQLDERTMHPAALSLAIANALPSDALVVYDGGHTTFWSNDIIPVSEPRERFHEPGTAQLGFGTPYAIALKAGAPDRTIVTITGDGSFGFTIQELDTARRCGLPIIVVVHNNAAWGIIRSGQAAAGFEFGTDLGGTDYAAIARGFGCHGETVERLSDFSGAFARALENGKPAVLDCRVGFILHPSMPRFAAAGRSRR